MHDRVLHIADKEGLELAPNALDTLSHVSGGDLRRAITTLQSAVRLAGKNVLPQTVLDVSGHIPEEVISGLLAACKRQGFARLHQQVCSFFVPCMHPSIHHCVPPSS